MTSRLNQTSNQTFVPGTDMAPVAKPLSELPKEERRKITTELLRIHNMVNALEQRTAGVYDRVEDQAPHKDRSKDKAPRQSID